MLEILFGSKTRIKLMRTLLRTKSGTGNALAGLCGINNKSATRVLNEWANLAVVTRHHAGNSYYYELNNDSKILNEIILPLFRNEEKIQENLKEILWLHLKMFEKDIVWAGLYGSYVSNKLKPKSDIDILVLIKNKKRIGDIEDHLRDLSEGIKEKYGFWLSTMALTPARLIKSKWLLDSVLRNNIPLRGGTLKTVLKSIKGKK